MQRKNNIVTKVMFRTTAVGDNVSSIEMRPDTQQFSSFYIDAVGMVHNPRIDRAQARLTELDCPADEAIERMRDILRDAALETSALTDKVGDNVMIVVLDNPERTIRTGLYISDRKRQSELFEKVRKEQPDMLDQFAERLTVSTPHVVMPGGIWGPSIGNPGWVVNEQRNNF